MSYNSGVFGSSPSYPLSSPTLQSAFSQHSTFLQPNKPPLPPTHPRVGSSHVYRARIVTGAQATTRVAPSQAYAAQGNIGLYAHTNNGALTGQHTPSSQHTPTITPLPLTRVYPPSQLIPVQVTPPPPSSRVPRVLLAPPTAPTVRYRKEKEKEKERSKDRDRERERERDREKEERDAERERTRNREREYEKEEWLHSALTLRSPKKTRDRDRERERERERERDKPRDKRHRSSNPQSSSYPHTRDDHVHVGVPDTYTSRASLHDTHTSLTPRRNNQHHHHHNNNNNNNNNNGSGSNIHSNNNNMRHGDTRSRALVRASHPLVTRPLPSNSLITSSLPSNFPHIAQAHKEYNKMKALEREKERERRRQEDDLILDDREYHHASLDKDKERTRRRDDLPAERDRDRDRDRDRYNYHPQDNLSLQLSSQLYSSKHQHSLSHNITPPSSNTHSQHSQHTHSFSHPDYNSQAPTTYEYEYDYAHDQNELDITVPISSLVPTQPSHHQHHSHNHHHNNNHNHNNNNNNNANTSNHPSSTQNDPPSQHASPPLPSSTDMIMSEDEDIWNEDLLDSNDLEITIPRAAPAVNGISSVPLHSIASAATDRSANTNNVTSLNSARSAAWSDRHQSGRRRERDKGDKTDREKVAKRINASPQKHMLSPEKESRDIKERERDSKRSPLPSPSAPVIPISSSFDSIKRLDFSSAISLRDPYERKAFAKPREARAQPEQKLDTDLESDSDGDFPTAPLSPPHILDVAAASNPNTAYRATMEDAHIVKLGFAPRAHRADHTIHNSGFFAVYDGHGGRATVDFIQKYFHREFARQLASHPPLKAFPLACSSIDARLMSAPYEECGSTACMVYLHPAGRARQLVAANLGDAQAVVALRKQTSNAPSRQTSASQNRASNKSAATACIPLSYVHVATDKKEIQRIKKAGGCIFRNRVNGSLAVSRAFGDASLKSSGVVCTPHVTSLQLTNEHLFMIIACDGVWDVFNYDEACDLIRNMNNAQQMADCLVQTAIERGTTDNVSAIIIRFIDEIA